MKWGLRDVVLTLVTAVSMLAGIALVLGSGPTMTLVGIVLIAVSTIVFVVDSKDLLVKTDRQAGK